MRALIAAALLLLLCSVQGLAQPVTVIGAVTPGHCVSFFSTTQIQDGGAVCGGGGGGITGPGSSTVGDLAVWNNITGTLLADTGLSFPGGFSFAGTLTGATAVTFPTSGTLATTATANVASVTGTAGQITVTPTTGAVIVSLPATITSNLTVSGTINNTGTFQIGGNTMTFPPTAQTLAGLGTAQTWTAVQTFTNSDIALLGSSTGVTTFTSANASASNFTLTLPAVTANLSYLVGAAVNNNCVKFSGTTGGITDAGATCAAGGGTPGGANTNVQFNNSSAFGGDSSFTYTTPGQVAIALGTITTNNKALSITGTWNAVGTTFDAPLFMNITATAEAAASTLFDFQVGGTSLLILQPKTNAVLSLGDGATASAFRVHNTVDALSGPTNYERGIFDFGVTTASTLTIGAQAGGTGTVRKVNFLGANFNFFFSGTNVFSTAQNNIEIFPSWPLAWNNGGSDAAGTPDTGIIRIAAGVVALTTGVNAVVTPTGYMQWGGQARVTADFSVTSSTALVNVTGLTVNVLAGRTYQFETELYVTDAAAGGVQAAIAGTATATAIQYTGYAIADNAIKAKTNATALATAVASTVTTETSGIIVRISGTITVNAAGTLTVQMAQNTSNGTATIAKRGSWFIVNDMP